MPSSGVNPAAVLMVIGLGFGSSPVAHAGPNERLMKLNHYSAKADAAYKAGDYAESVRYFQLVDKLRPFDAPTHYNMACSQSLAGQVDDAIASLQRSVEYGWDDAEWLGSGDEDLARLRNDSEFSKLVADAKKCAEENIYVYVPTTGMDGPAPLIVVLHGFGGNARGMAAYWKEVADEVGAVVVAPRGISRAARALQYGWHDARNPRVLDMESSIKAIDEAIAFANKFHKIDKDKVVLAGYSQGAAVALNLLATRPEEFAGVIAFAPNYKPGSEGVSWSEVAKKRKVRAFFTVGELDPSSSECAEVEKQMKDAGLEVKRVEIIATAHEIPADYLEHQKAAISFVLGR